MRTASRHICMKRSRGTGGIRNLIARREDLRLSGSELFPGALDPVQPPSPMWPLLTCKHHQTSFVIPGMSLLKCHKLEQEDGCSASLTQTKLASRKTTTRSPRKNLMKTLNTHQVRQIQTLSAFPPRPLCASCHASAAQNPPKLPTDLKL